MPKIEIKTLPTGPDIRVPDVIRRLGKALENQMGLSKDRFVILWDFILPGHFLYDGRMADTQPADTHHPLVQITLLEGMPLSREQYLVNTVAAELSRELHMDKSNICVSVIHLKSGKLFVFGDFKWTDQNRAQDLAI